MSDELDQRVRELEAERQRPTPPNTAPNPRIDYDALVELAHALGDDPDCRCDPATCEADESGEHCVDRGCGPCLHGPTEDPND